MKIPNWVSTNVLNVFSIKSRAYISNTKTRKLHWLNGIASDIWFLILNKKTIKEIIEFGNSQNLSKEEILSFIKLLKKDGLISDKRNKQNKKNSKPNLIGNNNYKDETKAFLVEWAKENIRENKLSSILFDTTYRCNENCIHCYCDRTDTKQEITLEKIKQIIDDAYELGTTKLTFTGGECTLISDFLEICKYVRKKRIELILFTNGQRFYDEPDLLDEIINLYPYMIGLSLYSMNPEIHDRVTGIKGSWNKTISVINKLLENNILVEIKCFLTKENAGSYKEVVDFANKNNCQLAIDANLLANKEVSNFEVALSDEQLKEFYTYAYQNKLAQRPNKINSTFLNDIPCQAGHTTIGIKPNLDITTCPNGNINFGNLKNKTLKEFWENKNKNSIIQNWLNAKNKNYKNCFKQEYCKYCDFCPLKYSNIKSRNMLCKTAKIKMEAAKHASSI